MLFLTYETLAARSAALPGLYLVTKAIIVLQSVSNANIMKASLRFSHTVLLFDICCSSRFCVPQRTALSAAYMQRSDCGW